MGGGGGGGRHSLIWPIRGCAAGQGVVFGLSSLNRVYNFMRTCPKLNGVCFLNRLENLFF